MSEENFFIRKQIKSKKIEIPVATDYIIEDDDDIIACGLERESFAKRNLEMFGEGIGLERTKNPIAQTSMRLEKYFSKREIAFLLSKQMVQHAFEEAKNKHENGE